MNRNRGIRNWIRTPIVDKPSTRLRGWLVSPLGFFLYLPLPEVCVSRTAAEARRGQKDDHTSDMVILYPDYPYDPDILSVNHICSALKIKEPIAFRYESYSLELRRGSASPYAATSSLYASTTQPAGSPLRTPRSYLSTTSQRWLNSDHRSSSRE